MIAITIDKLVKKFGEVAALKDVSLSIEKGELFGDPFNVPRSKL